MIRRRKPIARNVAPRKKRKGPPRRGTPVPADTTTTQAQFAYAGPFHVTITRDEEASVYVSRIDSLPILSQGTTREEARASVYDAASMHFAYLRDQILGITPSVSDTPVKDLRVDTRTGKEQQ